MTTSLQRRLMTQMGRAIETYGLIKPGDKIMVCLSGGKDSYAMATLLEATRRKVPYDFELVMVNLDQGQPGFNQQVIVDWCEERGLAHNMVYQDTYKVVTDKIPAGKTYCSLCSRLRRGILYDTAVSLGCTKIALGHHKDDAVETLLMSQMFSGQISSMPPLLRSQDGRNTVIRPLIFCSERDLIRFSEEQAFPILPCDLCGSQDGLQRQVIKRLLNELNSRNPKIKDNLFASMSNIRPSHILDPKVRQAFGFDRLAPSGKDEFLDA